MKAKNILMTFLLVTGTIAAKAAGYPPELALVSQPVMVYNSNSITIYYDVENIGDHTYRGDICLYLNPDNGYSYAEKYVKIKAGRIKRVAIDIPAYRIRNGRVFTIMPYYEMGNELYSFTTFEYFEPLSFCWYGPRDERWVVVTVPVCPTFYHRPGAFRFYYDGFRPPMHHHHGHFAEGPRPIDPMHHTYSYHHNHGYPNIVGPRNAPAPNGNNVAPTPNGNSATPAPNSGASVKPHDNHAGSMSSRSGNGSRTSSGSPASNGTSGATTRPSSASNSSNTRPNATTSGATTRPSSAINNESTRPSTTTSSTTSRPSGTSISSSNGRTSTSSTGRSGSSSTRSTSSRTGNNRGGSASGRK